MAFPNQWSPRQIPGVTPLIWALTRKRVGCCSQSETITTTSLCKRGPPQTARTGTCAVTESHVDFAATGANTVAGNNPAVWSFLYLDYQTPGLIGGYYNGATNTTIASAGNFTMSKTATGQYTLTVPGESPTTGMLIMSVANEVTSGVVTAPDDNILTYATGTGNSFTINSYDLPGAGFQDTKFVWAFISFANPIAPYVIPGDYNRDALVDDFDYQVWRSEYGKSSGWLPADGNGDGVVDTADYVLWRKNRASGSGAGAAAAIPEPAGATLILVLSLLRLPFGAFGG